ncbi:MAG: BTAD domain-containing putative transcriptional regulator [Candidatus Baltobacteraceae bacterium]
MQSRTAVPRPLAADSLRRAIAETSALGCADIVRSLELLLASVDEISAAGIQIEVCAGRVLVDGVAAKLTNRELEICLAIATHHRPVPGETLAALLYSDLDLDAALNRVKVYVHRVREKVAADFILCDRDGYRFRDRVCIDLYEHEELLRLIERRPFLSAGDRTQLGDILQSLHGRRNVPVWRWEWFGAIEEHMASIASRTASVLASDAFQRNAITELLELARAILDRDPCDEQAREIAIKAHLAAGRPLAAQTEFNRYKQALARELDAQPSAHLQKLLQPA